MLPHCDHPPVVPTKKQQSGEHELSPLNSSFDEVLAQQKNMLTKENGIHDAFLLRRKKNVGQRQTPKFFDAKCVDSEQSHLGTSAYTPCNLERTWTVIANSAPQKPKIQPATTAIVATHPRNGLPPKILRDLNYCSSTRSAACKENSTGSVKKIGRSRRNRKCYNTRIDHATRPSDVFVQK